ncbi:hypothetical protein [Paenibacillus antarcticus]|uniref:Uncharacterized protein n=1 Tax=Paenibacillus antarcticus TaxID=253703 RepID=A0A168JWC9_9BACL|nr:hypothetical protein [Paenibacillus antarcticus]OAB41195.1 hypothetical protein PBAT_21820 [Paenibacillus antarcticus]
MTATAIAIIQPPHSLKLKDVPASAPNAKAIDLAANPHKRGNRGYACKSNKHSFMKNDKIKDVSGNWAEVRWIRYLIGGL